MNKSRKAPSKGKKTKGKKPLKVGVEPVKVLPRTRTIPKALLEIHFDDSEGWLRAWRSFNPQLVARAVILAFRRRYLISQETAASRMGISVSTISKWESGKHAIRWNSKEGLVKMKWFKPQHFGLDADPSEFEPEPGEKSGKKKK